MKSLEQVMTEVVDFLTPYEVPGWPEILRQHQEEIRRLRTQQDWQHFLRNLHLFGGMGSLDDLVISRQNGNRVEDEHRVNQKLSELVASLYETVTHYRSKYQA